MPKVCIDSDEAWDKYIIHDNGVPRLYDHMRKYDIPQDEYDRILRVFKEFEEVQDYLERIVNA
jgi:hypothetical protein